MYTFFVGDDYQSSSWNAAPVAAAPMVNRPPEPAPMPPMMVAGSAETDEEKQKREGEIQCIVTFSITKLN